MSKHLLFPKIILAISIAVISFLAGGIAVSTSNAAATLASRLAGRILLQTQSKGEAWYVDPVSLGRYYLGKPTNCLNVMKSRGLGISNADLAQIKVATNLYHDQTYGFEITVPAFYSKVTKNPTSLATGDLNLEYAYNNINYLNIVVAKETFANYQLADQAGGFIFRFDSATHKWTHENGDTSEFIPKKMAGTLDAYLYHSGDVHCSWDIILVPNYKSNKFVQIENTTCKEQKGTGYVKPVYQLNTAELLSTFRFSE